MCLHQCWPNNRHWVAAVLGSLLLLSLLLLFLVSFIKVIHRAQEEYALLYSSEPPRKLPCMGSTDSETRGAGWVSALHFPAGPPGDSSAHWFGNSSSNTKCSVGSREGALVPHSVPCGTVRKSDPERLMKADVGMRLSWEGECFLLYTRGEPPPWIMKW